MIKAKKVEQVKEHEYLGSIITEDARLEREIKTSVGMGKG